MNWYQKKRNVKLWLTVWPFLCATFEPVFQLTLPIGLTFFTSTTLLAALILREIKKQSRIHLHTSPDRLMQRVFYTSSRQSSHFLNTAQRLLHPLEFILHGSVDNSPIATKQCAGSFAFIFFYLFCAFEASQTEIFFHRQPRQLHKFMLPCPETYWC